MQRNSVILASAFCFLVGLSLLIWLQESLTPPISDICSIQEGSVVRVRGEYYQDKLVGNCSVQVKFYRAKPEEHAMVEVVGEVEDWGLMSLGWQQV